MNKFTLKQTSEGKLIVFENNGPDFPVMEYETYPLHKEVWERIHKEKNLEEGVDIVLDQDFLFNSIELDEDHIQIVASPRELFAGNW